MAGAIHLPSTTTRVSANGYTYEIITVNHTYHATEDTIVEVDASAQAAVHLPTAGQTVVTLTLDSSADTSLFTKSVTLLDTSATGIYTFVIRHAGEAGGYKGDL